LSDATFHVFTRSVASLLFLPGKIMSRTLPLAVLSLFFFSFISSASAVTVIDTIGADTFAGGGGWTVADTQVSQQAIALPFNSSGAVTVESIVAFIAGTGTIDFGIMTDNGGRPSGTFLFSRMVSLSDSNPITLTSLDWSILGGTPYWLAAIPHTGEFGAWQDNPTGARGTLAFGFDNVWNFSTDAPLPEALISTDVITITPPPPATPLPAALPLFASGLTGAVLLARRRKRS
jgi:hypothetical protein